jgi:hypothetical protein
MTHSTIARPAAPNAPEPVKVHAEHGTPVTVADVRVKEVSEFWIVEDRWWTEHPIRRYYWELNTVEGANVVVFHDRVADGWFSQAA